MTGSAEVANVRTPPHPVARQPIIVVGGECIGKSQLVSSLTGKSAYVSNFRGSTLSCELYDHDDFTFIDTPGVVLRSDTETTRKSLELLAESRVVVLVISASQISDSLTDYLRIVRGKCGVLVVTHWDKVPDGMARQGELIRLGRSVGTPVYGVDARRIDHWTRRKIFESLHKPGFFRDEAPEVPRGLVAPPRGNWLEHPIIAAPLLVVPGVAAVQAANSLAELTEPTALAGIELASATFEDSLPIIKSLMVGPYGLLTMFPLLFVWALPTVVIFTLLLGAMKASGVLDRISVGVHPLFRPFGLGGRDVVRVMMGFGCNVPAVISTRSCSTCSRNTCISSIAFGSACSYQLGATLAVFAAVGHSYLVVPYLGILLLSTLIYARLISSPLARSAENLFVGRGTVYLSMPTPKAVWTESRTTLLHFLWRALPIFLLISVSAALLEWAGATEALARLCRPLAQVFGLPGDAVTPIVMASIRKDGILLFAQPELAERLTAGQVLVGVYLASVLTPCLVTALTIARERSPAFTGRLLARQALAAISFTLVLSLALRGWGQW